MATVLVTYASKHGSTEQIAESIGNTLREKECIADVLPVAAVREITDYDGIVLGSAVYSRKWMSAAADFITRHADQLAEIPTWIFSSGPTGKGNPLDLMDGWLFPENLADAIDLIDPIEVKLFHGRLDLRKLTLAELMIVKGYGGAIGDYRNWRDIRMWALSIYNELVTMPKREAPV